MNKCCGNCKSFLKSKYWGSGKMGGNGICQKFDGRTNTDGGHRCESHEYIKFLRKKSIIDKLFGFRPAYAGFSILIGKSV